MKNAFRQSTYFAKTLRDAPSDEKSTNAKLLEQAGYIQKLMSGVFTYLPLGLRVLNNIERIIREEIENIGGQELYMPAMQPQELWSTTHRWDDLKDIMYQFKDTSDHWVGLATTHEETITAIVKQRIASYKDLPQYLYQIQDKFRNEPRAKSGLIRGREFAMKDLYSFHTSEEDLDRYYEKVAQAYLRIFKRCGVEAMMIEASGGAFSKKYSHEFQVLAGAGEDTIVYCPNKDFAQNAEIATVHESDPCPVCKKQLLRGTGVEVGNIFKLGTRFSEALHAYYRDKDGKEKPIVMASYGIGPGRLMGTIVEIHHDNQGISWPKEITPFQVHLINLADDTSHADNVFHQLEQEGISVLYDDRDVSAGIKFKDADLLGISLRAVISNKTGEKVEIKERNAAKGKEKLVSDSSIVKAIKEFYA